jgi:hypothetical protein
MCYKNIRPLEFNLARSTIQCLKIFSFVFIFSVILKFFRRRSRVILKIMIGWCSCKDFDSKKRQFYSCYVQKVTLENKGSFLKSTGLLCKRHCSGGTKNAFRYRLRVKKTPPRFDRLFYL